MMTIGFFWNLKRDFSAVSGLKIGLDPKSKFKTYTRHGLPTGGCDRSEIELSAQLAQKV